MSTFFQGYSSLIQPEVFATAQAKAQQQQQENPMNQNAYDPNAQSFAQNQRRYAEEQERQRGSNILQKLMMGGVGALAGRGMPAYNMHEQQGRTGLVAPEMTGQQTNLPNPLDRQLEQASNLAAIVHSLPPSLYQSSEQIAKAVDATVPQMQRALKQPYSIYEVYPDSFIVNRMNLALQRNREQSIYAVV